MKKHLLTFALLASAVAASAQTLYSTDFATEDEFNKWTVIDANNDDYTWKFDVSATPSHAFYSYSGTNAADDWLISPEITPTKSGKVMVKFDVYGGYFGENISVCTGNTATAEAMSTVQKSYEDLKGELTSDYFLLDAVEGEPFRVGFHATTPADRYRVYVCSFAVEMVDKVIDLKVDSVLSPVSGKDLGQETVKVRIKNDGSDAADGFDVAFKVNDNEPVVEHITSALAAGESMEYTFAAKADLSEGPKNHIVKAYTISPSELLPGNDTTTVKVRCQKAIDPPYKMSFESNEDTEDILFYNLNNDEGEWQIYTSMWQNFARTGYSALCYNYDTSSAKNAAEDWAVLPAINVEEGNYVLRFYYSALDDRNEEKMAVYWGSSNTPEAMTNLIVDYPSITGANYREGVSILKFDTPQTIYIGFKANSDANKNWLCVDDLQFYKASGDDVDFVANSIDMPYDYVRTPNDKDVTFEVRSVGIKAATGTVKLTVDGVEKYSEALTLEPQEYKTLTASNAIAGLDPGKHTLKLSIESNQDTDLSNNAIEREINVLGTPALYYDFEDGKIPADFTFAENDGNTVDESMLDEVNEDGWGIVNIEKHAVLGEHMLIGTSYMTDKSKSANRWVILPQFHINGENTYLVWDANSINPLYLEDYYVKVSSSSPNPKDYWYSTAATIKGESVNTKTRGVNIAVLDQWTNNVDKDVYVAFNIFTSSGELLCLDNIGIYGDITPTGIQNVNADYSDFFNITDGSISTPNAESITVTDMSGRTMLTAKGAQANIESLKSGIYMATIKTANGLKSIKFVKK